MIGIVDYGMGNLLSVYHAVQFLGLRATVCSQAEQLRSVDRVILPGVGAFRDCMAALHESGFVNALHDAVMRRAVPTLGICLGMQVMARKSVEGGEHHGLGWIDAEVVRLDPSPARRVPHVGWNAVTHRNGPMFRGLPSAPDFYFVHSYHVRCADDRDVEATCEHGSPITAALRHDNIVAMQFHPEKSQQNGLRVLENFAAWKP